MSATPRVFLSATKVDLVNHRVAAKNAIIDVGCQPVTMEHFAAEDAAPLDVCLREVESCHALVVLVANRYGWIPEAQPDPKTKSITWLECEHAVARRILIFALILDPAHPWPPDHCDKTHAIAALERGETPSLAVSQLAKFKAWLRDGRVAGSFTNPESVRAEVLHALHKWRNAENRRAFLSLLRRSERRRVLIRWANRLRNQYPAIWADHEHLPLRRRVSVVSGSVRRAAAKQTPRPPLPTEALAEEATESHIDPYEPYLQPGGSPFMAALQD